MQVQTDKLDAIFDLQRKLQARLRDSKTYPLFIDEQVSGLCTAIIHEAVELQRLTNWKWWKKQQPLDFKEAHKEIIDLWHFLVDVSIVTGLDPQKILDEYKEKNKINHTRQDEGY